MRLQIEAQEQLYSRQLEDQRQQYERQLRDERLRTREEQMRAQLLLSEDPVAIRRRLEKLKFLGILTEDQLEIDVEIALKLLQDLRNEADA